MLRAVVGALLVSSVAFSALGVPADGQEGQPTCRPYRVANPTINHQIFPKSVEPGETYALAWKTEGSVQATFQTLTGQMRIHFLREEGSGGNLECKYRFGREAPPLLMYTPLGTLDGRDVVVVEHITGQPNAMFRMYVS